MIDNVFNRRPPGAASASDPADLGPFATTLQALALSVRERRALVCLVLVAVAVRLATLGAYPLMESTESRYAEIARKMLETGRWLVPQIEYGVPFWGKPPLSMWLTAASMSVFGVNEFAARLPSLVLTALTGLLMWTMAWLRGGRDQALWTLAVFATTGFVFVAAGATMTDSSLALGTTLSMAGFWLALHGPERYRGLAGYAFFVGLGIGLLAKGPVAVVLTLMPVAAAVVVGRSWRGVWRQLPWITGTALAAAISVPWYWAAERASPGFLDYFLIGEHWKRYVEPGWSGDLYGVAHARPHGTIWVLWIAAALPWSIVAIGAIAQALARHRHRIRTFASDPWRMYLLFWSVAPMVFFTLSGNVLIAYVLPGLPAFLLLIAEFRRPDGAGTRAVATSPAPMRPVVRQVLVVGTIVYAIFIAIIAVMHVDFETNRSQKALVRDYERLRAGSDVRLVYFPKPPPSAEFYSRGTALGASTHGALAQYLDAARPAFFAFGAGGYDALPAPDKSKLEFVGTYGEYRLLRSAPR